MKNKLQLLFLISFLSVFSALAQITDRGLIAHYNFVTNTNNQVSNDFHLTPIVHFGSNLPTFNTADGRSFVSTDGTNSLLNESELANFLQNAHDKSFSISFWMRTNNLPPSAPATRTYLEVFRSLYVRRSNTEFGNSTDRLAADFSDMYLYNRALSPGDIGSLYNNESPMFISGQNRYGKKSGVS